MQINDAGLLVTLVIAFPWQWRQDVAETSDFSIVSFRLYMFRTKEKKNVIHTSTLKLIRSNSQWIWENNFTSSINYFTTVNTHDTSVNKNLEMKGLGTGKHMWNNFLCNQAQRLTVRRSKTGAFIKMECIGWTRMEEAIQMYSWLTVTWRHTMEDGPCITLLMNMSNPRLKSRTTLSLLMEVTATGPAVTTSW